MIDTCQANTMYSKLYSPNIIATGSSELDQSSYSHHADSDVGVAVIDRYTYYNLEFLEQEVRDLSSKQTLGALFSSYDYSKIHSNPGVRYDLFPGGADAARARLLTDFFGNVQIVEVDTGRRGNVGGGPAEEEDAEGAGNTLLEEELVALSRRITELRHLEAQAEDAERESLRAISITSRDETSKGSAKANSSGGHAAPGALPRTSLPGRGPGALTDDDWWQKKLVGAAVLTGCAALWGASAFLETRS